MTLTERDLKRMEGVNPVLVAAVKRAAEITEVDFIVTEGLRTPERQAQLVKAGASQTMNSKHLVGLAVDVAARVDGEVRWDWPLYLKIATAFKQASCELGAPVAWGGSWKLLAMMPLPITSKQLSRSFPDGPHYELRF
jgi:peptidoglycan L-alanyl-D-glutamate endopeptidase CwlK